MATTANPPTGAARFVGASVKRVEDPKFLMGQGQYVDDIKLPRMVHAAFLRSPHGHARIVSADASAARALPGVETAHVGDALDQKLVKPIMLGNPAQGQFNTRLPLLCQDKVRFVGDLVGVAVAGDRYAAEDALEAIQVEYEELPAVTDPLKALAPDAPVIDEEMAAGLPEGVPPNVAGVLPVQLPSPEAVQEAFAKADRVVKGSFRIDRQSQVPMETRGVVASWDSAMQTLTVWSATQGPHMIRTILAEYLGLPESKVRVIGPDVGGGFGQKAAVYREEFICALLAMELGRPVKWIEDRRENLMAATHGRGEYAEAEVPVLNDGTMLALKVKLIVDTGAYQCIPFGGSALVAFDAVNFLGHWKWGPFAIEGYAVVTNAAPLFAKRGPWGHICSWVNEGMVDLIARELNLDPVAVRRKNVIQKADQPWTMAMGMVYEAVSPAETQEIAFNKIGYEAFRQQQAEARQRGEYLGVGFCTYLEPTAFSSVFMTPGQPAAGLGYETVKLRMEPNGEVLVALGTMPHGQGTATAVTQVVADELGVEPQNIRVVYGDTAQTPYGLGTGGSRNAVVSGGASQRAAAVVKEKLLKIAGHLLEISPEDLAIANGTISVKGAPDKSLPLREVARTAYLALANLPPDTEPGLEGTGVFDSPVPITWANATHACTVRVDAETGQVKIERYVIAEDCGTMINPMIVEGQARGGVADGIGGALLESIRYDEHGQFLTGTFLDYLIPTTTEVPNIEIEHLITPSPYTVLGIKGAGEGGAIGAPPAVLLAIQDALAPFGVTVSEAPMTPDRIRAAIRAAQG